MVKNQWYWLEVKFDFFPWFCCANQFNASTYLPPPQPPHGHLTIVCAQEVDIWKKKGLLKGGLFESYLGEAGYLNQNCKVLLME